MSRWKYDEHGWLQAEGQDESVEGINEAMRFHNTDCDAYEKRIAELEKSIFSQDRIIEQQCRELMDDPQIKEWRSKCQDFSNENRSLLAELARTRAESLRVVKVGELDVHPVQPSSGLTWEEADEKWCYLTARETSNPEEDVEDFRNFLAANLPQQRAGATI